MTVCRTLCAPGYREVEPLAGPKLRPGAAKLPSGQKPQPGTPPPWHLLPEGLREKLGENTRVHFPVRSARRPTPPTIRTPTPSMDATTHHLLITLTSSLPLPAGLRRCQSGRSRGWRRSQLHKHWRQPASTAGPCATPAPRAPGFFSVAPGSADPWDPTLQHRFHRLRRPAPGASRLLLAAGSCRARASPEPGGH